VRVAGETAQQHDAAEVLQHLAKGFKIVRSLVAEHLSHCDWHHRIAAVKLIPRVCMANRLCFYNAS
jgi:hypothetical protein